MANVTEVTHRVILTHSGHMLVVVGGAQVDVLDIDGGAPSLTDLAGRVAGQAAHDCGHHHPGGHQAAVVGHPVQEHGGLRPTDH